MTSGIGVIGPWLLANPSNILTDSWQQVVRTETKWKPATSQQQKRRVSFCSTNYRHQLSCLRKITGFVRLISLVQEYACIYVCLAENPTFTTSILRYLFITTYAHLLVIQPLIVIINNEANFSDLSYSTYNCPLLVVLRMTQLLQ